MAEGLGFGRRNLVRQIVLQNWKIEKPEEKTYNFQELLFIIQEMMTEEGKQYFEKRLTTAGYNIFRHFVKHLLYRNLANYDSMILITSEKGCITGDALLEMPRDLKKYPKGVPLKELEGKGPLYVYSFNRLTEKLELKKCDGVEFVKEDDVWEIELTNGMKLQATKDHPFLLMGGFFKELERIHWYSRKKEDGSYEYGRYMESKELLYTDRLRIFSRPHLLKTNDNRIKVDYSKIDRKNGDTGLKHSMIEQRFIMEQLGHNLKGKIIHHKDGNNFNHSIENLHLITQKQHYKLHGIDKYKFQENNKFCYNTGYSTTKKDKLIVGEENFIKHCSESRKSFCQNNIERVSQIAKERVKNNINSNHIAKGGIVKSIKYIGKRKVYDVVNVKYNHNFIVNGFIVSNTGKSSAAIMLAKQWCNLMGRNFDPKRHIAYNNADVMTKIDLLNKFEPIICDEAIRFASAADWNRRENKELKKKLAQVRTKHLLYILCFPLKIYKLEKTYLESYTNYWVDLFGRGRGAIYVRDKNPVQDSWRMKDFTKIGSYTEFTQLSKVEKTLKNHPNFWQIIKFPRPPDWLYEKYLKVREKNIYDDENVLANISKEDIHRALLILALRDIMMHDTTLTMNRIILHVQNEYDIKISKGMVQTAVEDAKQLVTKIREQALQT